MNHFPSVYNVPFVTTDQMREVDRLMIESYGIQLLQMMENAGRCLAHLARVRFLDGDPRGKRVVVMAGSGGNGGGALVAARRLHNYGADVSVMLTKANLSPVPEHQLRIVQQLELPLSLGPPQNADFDCDLILDGVIGYSLSGAPQGIAADLIRWANNSGVPIVALDAPSGVDTTSGTRYDPAIDAVATLTLALPKKGLLLPDVAPYIGELYLADISVPPELYSQPSLDLDVTALFAKSDIVQLK